MLITPATGRLIHTEMMRHLSGFQRAQRLKQAEHSCQKQKFAHELPAGQHGGRFNNTSVRLEPRPRIEIDSLPAPPAVTKTTEYAEINWS